MPQVTPEIIDAVREQVKDDALASHWLDAFHDPLTQLTSDQLIALLRHAATHNVTDDELRAFYRTLTPEALTAVLHANAITLDMITSAQQREMVLIRQLTNTAAAVLLRAVAAVI